MPTQIDFTIKKDGSGDYTSIKSFVLAEMKDLVAADENLFVTIFGDGWDSVTPLSETFIDFNNFTTDTTRNITFFVREEDRHDFTAGSGFVFTISTSFGFVMRAKHVVLDGFEIANTSNTNNLFDTSTNAKMTNCLVHDVDYAQFSGDGENNIHYNYASRGGFTNTFYNGGTLKNITCIQLLTEGGFTGDIGIANANCTNVVLYTDKPTGSFTNFYNCTGDYNAANKAEGQPGANSFDTVLTTDFVDFDNDNYISKLGGQLESSGEGGTFIGASLESGGGGGDLLVTGDTANFNHNAIAASIDLTGSIEVTGSTANFDYSAITGSIDLTGAISITGQTANFDYNSANGLIDLTGELSVTGQTANLNYIAKPADIDLTGEITIAGATCNFDHTSVNVAIELGTVINVVGQTANFDTNGVNAEVSLTGDILVTGQTAIFNYIAMSGSVIIGTGQKIGKVTAGFADSGISVQYKQSTITVKFGE